MHRFKLKILLRGGLLLLLAFCWFRQKRNRERMVAVMLLIPAFILLIPTYTFMLTLLQSFLFQAMLVYGVLSIAWIVKYHYRLASVNFAIYLLLLFKINSPIDTAYQLVQGNEQLKVLQFNILTTNLAHEETIQRVLQLNPDLVSFQEVSFLWADVLEKGLRSDYPFYKVVRNREGSQGIAIFSKHPITDSKIHLWSGTVNIAGKIQIGTEEVNFLCLHTRSPTTKKKWYIRNQHLNEAKEFIASKEGEFLVLGDFNTVPWDKRLLSFKSTTKLKDSRKKLTPTYPTWNPFIAQIPIDYIFHSDGIRCDSLEAVRITSDHKAIMGSYALN